MFTATITATNSAGNDSEALIITVSEGSLQVAIDSSLAFAQSANLWTRQTIETHDGIDAARSPAIGNNQTAYFETSITAAAGGDAVTFWWKVSSEGGFDFLRFLVDGAVIQQISGDQDWSQVAHALAGGTTSTIRIEFVKDGSVADGDDAGYVDEFAVASDNPLPTFVSGMQATGLVGQSFVLDVDAIGATGFGATGLPTGLSINPVSGVISGTPTVIGATTAAVMASNTNGTTNQQLLIEILPLLPEALDAQLPQVVWSTSGPAEWFSLLGTTHDGVDAAQSGAIDHSESSTLSTARQL